MNMKINQIELFISNYDETVLFYKEVLQFEGISESENFINFRVGSSVLTLHKDEEHCYFYHFAFNIPPNLFRSAKQWIQERIPLLIEKGEDEAHFIESKAEAIYFEDPAGNIVEYIARKETTPNVPEQHFHPKHVLEISEIGVSTDELKEFVDELIQLGAKSRNHVPISYVNFLNFIGEYEDGNFILVGPLGRRWYFSTKRGIFAPVIIKTNYGTIKNF